VGAPGAGTRERMAPLNYLRIVVAAIAATVAYYIIGTLASPLLAKYYLANSAAFRTRDAIVGYLPFGFVGTLVAMFAVSSIYALSLRGRGSLGEGARLGFLVGLVIAGACVLHDYVIVQMGGNLAAAQAVGELIGWTISGVVIGLIYRPSRILRS
jgi:hypothetical protein